MYRARRCINNPACAGPGGAAPPRVSFSSRSSRAFSARSSSNSLRTCAGTATSAECSVSDTQTSVRFTGATAYAKDTRLRSPATPQFPAQLDDRAARCTHMLRGRESGRRVPKTGSCACIHRRRHMPAIWPMIRELAWTHHGTKTQAQDASIGEGHDMADLCLYTTKGPGEVRDETYPHRTTEGPERTPADRGTVTGPARPGHRPGQGSHADRALPKGAPGDARPCR